MLDKAGAVPTLLTRLKKLPVGCGLDLRTYKRDRSVVITRTGNDTFTVEERGFSTADVETDLNGMRKLLKQLMKREFPRSNKIRVYETKG